MIKRCHETFYRLGSRTTRDISSLALTLSRNCHYHPLNNVAFDRYSTAGFVLRVCLFAPAQTISWCRTQRASRSLMCSRMRFALVAGTLKGL